MAFCELTIRSTVLRMDVKVSVIIPEDRKDYRNDPKEKKYPCLYVLHGTSEDNSTWLNSSNIYLLTRDLPLFTVFVSAYNTCYVNTDFGMRMQDFIAEELPYKMERLFPISDRTEDRFIMGESMGGYGVWLTTLLHPDRYAKAVPLSGGGFRNFRHVLETGASSVDELALEVYKSGKMKTEYKMFCGTDDMFYERVHNWDVWFKENCPNTVYSCDYSPGHHDFYFWNRILPEAIRFLGFECRES